MLPEWTLVGLEAALLVGVLAIAWWLPPRAARLLDPVRRAARRLANRRTLAVAAVGVFAFALSAAVSLVDPPPPAFHDEFSNLLAADTFAEGRLTNPTHALWRHFESFHVLQRPTYQSKYPPGQAAMLAFGQVVAGHPIVGTWIGMGLACAALCWMLQGFLPARWALVGGLLPVIRLGVFGPDDFFVYWSRSYWGGALPMLGGALVYGGLIRLTTKGRPRDAIALAAGLGLLANTRPFEGLVASLPVAAMLGHWLWRQRGTGLGACLLRSVAPMLAVLAVVGAGMAGYNARVTGDPLRLPYQAYEDTHGSGVGAFFTGEPARERPADANPEMRRFYRGMDRLLPGRLHTLESTLALVWDRSKNYLAFYLGPALALPLLLNLLPVLRRRWMRFAAVTCGLVGLEIFYLGWVFPHYPAPATPLVFALAVQGLRELRVWRVDGRRIGRNAVAAIGLLCAVSFAISFGRFASRAEDRRPVFQYQRARVVEHLESQPGRHLVVVRYDPDHRPHEEWVYNRADIDGAKIAWARELDPESNRQLRAHFAGHDVWLLHVSKTRAFLKRHP